MAAKTHKQWYAKVGKNLTSDTCVGTHKDHCYIASRMAWEAATEAMEEKFTSHNNARDAIAFLQQAVDARIDDNWLKEVRAFLKQATAPVA